MKLYKYIILGFISIFIISSCDLQRVYEENSAIENEKWELKTTFKHGFTIPDTLQLYNMYINIRNTVDYQYSNLYLFVTTDFPNGQKAKDTLECILANKEGKWFGKGNGRIKDCKILFKPKFRFAKQGKYTLTIQHAMRDNVLSGISDIGIRLEKYN